jgi:hypothetical protein
VGIALVLYLVVRATATALLQDSGAGNRIGLAAGGLLGLSLLAGWWGPKQTTSSWRKGSDGEELTERQLRRLPNQFVCLHDRRMPGSRANIDHLVIGPTGIFTVETKNYSSEIVIGRKTVQRAGRSMDTVVAQAIGQAAAVRALLDRPVRPLVCIQTGTVSRSWFTKPTVRGVRFCTGRHLVKTIQSFGRELSADEVRRLAALADSELWPA